MRRKIFSVSRAVIRDFIKEHAEVTPTDELIDDFIDYLNIDVFEYLKDNWKGYEDTDPKSLHGRSREDYLYCETCKTFVDFWKYDHSRDAAGHADCKVRSVTQGELKALVKECAEAGCFAEQEGGMS